jgi:hypothetical protein
MSIQLTESNHVSHTLVRRERKRDIERHPVSDQVQTIGQLGVPDKFPAVVT